MYVVLLTGGLASGKDTVSAYLAELGATVLDLDLIAKEEQESEDVLAQLTDTFGDDILDSEGMLNRKVLAERAFSDSESADKLNAICWPPVKERIANYILADGCQPIQGGELLVIQIPLLAEAPDLLDLHDEIISVSVPEELRFKRAIARGMDPKDAQNRLALQASDEERAAISDTIFENSGTREALKAQVLAWYEDRIAHRLV
jgi:dephospho-CoA kinase